MRKITLLFAMLISFAVSYAQNGLWQPAEKNKITNLAKVERETEPVAFHLFYMNPLQLKQMLEGAPQRDAATGQSSLIIPFPNGEGFLEHYRVYEASIMHPDLAAQHQDIKSYVGQGIENPSATVRFSVTTFGVHAMVLSPKGTVYTDPYTTDRNYYIVYRKANLRTARTFGCEVEGNAVQEEGVTGNLRSGLSNDGVLRTYRLAMASTTEYSAFHVNAAGLNNGTDAQKKAAVLAAMNVTMTRVNGIYERDLAITMQFVPNNEDIIFITTDNFSNNSAGQLIGQSQSVITSIIGSANYDIGHTVSTGGGGLAGLGVVCVPSAKARGITGSPFPVGDPYDIDFVAHEIGHQFGANHTFNGTTGSCQGNANSSTAVEPGSGSTIMAYAGICPGSNVQGNSDAYFHTVSLDQIYNYVQGTGCGTFTNLDNTAPQVPALTSYNIPRSTAFVLRGTDATDAEGDALTYTWEQTNANGAGASVPTPTATTGPNFRSLPPSTSRDRYMPEFSSVLNGNLTPTWEVVPSVTKTLSFAYTVRDNNPVGGQTTRNNMSVNVRGAAGPFAVTSQSEEGVSWLQNSQQTITWAVAGTTANNINTATVNILLSTDNGLTFTTVLAANTPNDGSEVINVPNVTAPYCRIMIEAVGNIYYAVNSRPFAIGVQVITDCNTYTNTTSQNIPDGGNNFSTSVINVNEGQVISSVKVSVDINHTYISDLILAVLSPDGTQVTLWEQQCGDNDDLNVTFSDTGTTVQCQSPISGTILPFQSLSAFTQEQAQGNWVLGFVDVFNQDAGVLNSWSVEVCSQTVAPLSTADYGLQGFSIYPNPNSGNFTVAFTSASQSNITIEVHDIRGRQVFENNYTNTGAFSGNVNLDSIQSGVYLVTVQDGSRKEVRKIVIR